MGSTGIGSNFETVDALKQNAENASDAFLSGSQFSKIKVFFGLFLN